MECNLVLVAVDNGSQNAGRLIVWLHGGKLLVRQRIRMLT